MRYTPIVIGLLVVLLSSCGKGATPTGDTPPSPYPSIPLNESTTGTAAEMNLLPPPQAKTVDSFSAKGTEPFWAVEVDKNSVVFSRPGTGSTVTQTFTVTQDDKGAIISIKGVKGDFFLTLVKSTCTDGMSNAGYAYSATLNVGAEVLRGCANRK